MDLDTQNRLISDHIRQHGWHCLHVFSNEPGEAGFSYSIGFAESYGAPEVLVLGFEREKAHALLHECASLLQRGHKIRPGVEDAEVLAGGYKAVFREVLREKFSGYLGTALGYYQQKPFGAVVMFLPDREHRFPWQSGYDYLPADEALTLV